MWFNASIAEFMPLWTVTPAAWKEDTYYMVAAFFSAV
jgi:hypothetical protein